MPDGDSGPDMRGQLVLQYSEKDKRFSLVVTGPSWPADNINPTAEIYYDSAKKKFQLKPGFSSTARIDEGGRVFEKDYDYDLTDLPEDLKTLVGNGPHNGPPAQINLPDCQFLRGASGFMTWEEYNKKRKVRTSIRPSWYTPPPGGIDLFPVSIEVTLYPPLTRSQFGRLIAKCLGL